MEKLKEFKIIFYIDSNKRTKRRIFDLDDYSNIETMLEDVELLIKDINEEGVLEHL